MLLTNPQTDPIIEILRLAYRRGLAIRQAQKQKKEIVYVNLEQIDSQPSEDYKQEQEGNNVSE